MSSDVNNKPAETYADIINADGTGAPDFLKHAPSRNIGTEPIATDRYWSKEFYDAENTHVWTRTWQMACLTAEVENVGDCFLCLLYTSPSPRDKRQSRMPSSA